MSASKDGMNSRKKKGKSLKRRTLCNAAGYKAIKPNDKTNKKKSKCKVIEATSNYINLQSIPI